MSIGPAGNSKASTPVIRPGATLSERVGHVLNLIRPAVQADGGDVELVEVIGNTAYVNMTGACNGCQMAAMTIAGIQQRLMEVMGEFIKVVPASEMSKLVSIEVA